VSYNAIISASEKGMQWYQALALLREMFDRRFESIIVGYNASISASEKGIH
jgi:pentatricopeptide repeat protein